MYLLHSNCEFLNSWLLDPAHRKSFSGRKWARSYDEIDSRTYENTIHLRRFAHIRSHSEPRKKSDVIPIESLKSLRKMLIRWKSKDKTSNKGSSGDGSGSKKKRKSGREGEAETPLTVIPLFMYCIR